MIQQINRYFHHIDPRGSIEGLIQFGTWKEINLIKSQDDCIRGNHYHKKLIELFIILKGTIEVTTQPISDDKPTGNPEVHIVQSGDVFIINPYTLHTFYTKTTSEWINVLSEPINPDNPDIFYLKKPDLVE